LLAPSIGKLPASVRPFFTASRELYPKFIAGLRGIEPALSLVEGLLDLSTGDMPSSESPTGRQVTPADVSILEPAVFAPGGGRFHERDGAVDNQMLVRGLRRAVSSFSCVDIRGNDPIAMVDLRGSSPGLETRNGERLSSSAIVLAAGAWSAAVRGLPRPLPVIPLKGQMLAVDSRVLRHAVMGDDVYLVPRRDEIAIGATVEDAGFDATTSPEAIETLRQAAIRICPALREATVLRTWAGLRPATPDMLPILGRDPEFPRLLYACGHSKNGILLAPATAVALAAWILDTPTAFDRSPFHIDRFASQSNREIR
jgi:glycine oxidase